MNVKFVLVIHLIGNNRSNRGLVTMTSDVRLTYFDHFKPHFVYRKVIIQQAE